MSLSGSTAANLALTGCYKKFGIYPNAYYNYLKNRKQSYYARKQYLMRQISVIYHRNDGKPGYRMMCDLLRGENIKICKLTVLRYMQEQHLRSIARKNRKFNCPKSENVLFPNIISQDFNPSERNRVWCTDFTNLEYGGGTVRYNCTIIDLYDRSAVASMNSSLLNSELAINTLKRALATHKIPKGLILHSDQGCQFTSKDFTEFCKLNHIQQSGLSL